MAARICKALVCCSSSHIVGIGLRGQCPLGLKCWLYFPESNCPFYRTTVFSHYAPKNCPSPDSKLSTVCLVITAISLPYDLAASEIKVACWLVPASLLGVSSFMYTCLLLMV